MSHTPAPWFYRSAPPDESGVPIVQRGKSGGFSVLDYENKDRAESDARLIASAPDLLTALVVLYTKTKHLPGDVYGHALSKARAATEKATGAE